MPQSLLQPAPFRTPFFAKDGQIHEEWRRFFLSSQALVNLLLQEITLGMPHPSLVSAEEGDPSDPFIVPGPTGPAGGAGPPGKPGFDGEDGVSLFDPMLDGPASAFALNLFTLGSVIFAGLSGALAQNNGQLFWDNTNFRLGVGTTVPQTALHVHAGSETVFLSDTFPGIAFRDNALIASAVNGADVGYVTSAGGYAPTSVAKDLVIRTAHASASGWTSGEGNILFVTPSGNSFALTERMRLTGTGGLNLGGTTDPGAGNVAVKGKATTYNNIATAGWGVPAVNGFGRATGQTGANASVASYTVGAADGSFWVSVNFLLTAFTSGNIAGFVSYTDESSTARTLQLNLSNLSGTLVIAAAAVGPFEGVPLHIRVAASTLITISTVSGAFVGTYNVEGAITQIA